MNWIRGNCGKYGRNAKCKIKTKQKSTEKGFTTVEGTTSGRSLRLKAGLTAKSVFFLWKVGLWKNFNKIFPYKWMDFVDYHCLDWKINWNTKQLLSSIVYFLNYFSVLLFSVLCFVWILKCNPNKFFTIFPIFFFNFFREFFFEYFLSLSLPIPLSFFQFLVLWIFHQKFRLASSSLSVRVITKNISQCF